MIFVNRIFNLKIVFLITISLIGEFSFAQEKEIDVHLRDYHTAEVTDVLSSKAYPYFFTADASGKVLLHSNESKRVVSTIKPASGFPIKNMRLSNDDLLLSVNQKIELSDGKSDSLISIEVFTGKRLMQNQGNVNFIGNQNDAIILQDTNAEGSLNIIDVFNKKFENVKRYYFSGKVTLAAYDFASQQMAVVEGNIGNQLNVKIQNGNDYENIEKIEIPKKLKILDLFYEEEELYALTHTKENNNISIYNLYKDKSFSKSMFKEKSGFSPQAKINRTETDSGLQIAITSIGSLILRPFIIEKSGSKFKSWIPETKNAIGNYLYLPDQKEHLFFETENSHFGSVMRYGVYDAISKSKIDAVPNEEKKFYYGSYLPNNDWMVIGDELNNVGRGLKQSEYQIKYYENGTFNNRFNKLDYSSYILVYHGITEYENGAFRFNKYTGIHPFFGSKKTTNGTEERGFFAYDLMKDEVKTISTYDTKKTSIIDYDSNNNRLLLSERHYYNGGHNEPGSFILLQDKTVVSIDGLYKFGAFSGNGQFLVLISDKNLLTIRSIADQNIIHSETLTDGKYKIFKEGETGFAITNAYWSIDLETCNQITIGYEIKENLKIERQEANCVHVLDTANYGDTSYLSMEFLGLVIGKKILKFPPSDFPTHISTSKDGEKIMVSFNSGRIKIYDVATAMPIMEMLHPDKNSHVFIDKNGNFFSNVNPQDYMYAIKDGKGVALAEIESKHFKPEKILQHFGEPNQDYLATLEKALVLKKNTQTTPKSKVAQEKTSTPAEKGDLYLLSIGVSQYKNNDYNLTFADKDALDMARIYGTVNSEDREYYNTNFLGERFHLIDGKEGFTEELRKYSELFSSNGQLYPLNPTATIWLEVKYGDYFLWDFNKQITEPIKFPSKVEVGNYRMDKHLFVDPDGKGFYVTSDNDKFYFYNFSKKSFESVALTVQKDREYFDTNRLSFLENGQYAYFEENSDLQENYISIYKGSLTSNEQSTIRFGTDYFNTMSEEGTTMVDSTKFRAQFRAMSSNASHLIYSDSDEQLFYKNLADESLLPQKLKVPKVEETHEISIANDGLSFSIRYLASNEEKQKVVFYDITGKVIETKIKGESVIGVSLFDNHYVSIEKLPPITDQYGTLIDEDLEKADPYSFKKVKVKYLTNENATSSSIEEQLNQFFQSVNQEDQVVVFLAGHGVLDENLNYYFAPHDMDFKNVAENGVPLESILRSITETTSNNKLLLMDSCHSGNTLDIDSKTMVSADSDHDSTQRGSKSRSVGPQNDFKVSDVISGLFEDFLSQSGVTIISASSGADVAYENETMGNGAFTSAYISLLKERLLSNYTYDGKDNYELSVDIDEEGIDYLLREVMQLTNGKQLPDLRELNTSSNLKMW